MLYEQLIRCSSCIQYIPMEFASHGVCVKKSAES